MISKTELVSIYVSVRAPEPYLELSYHKPTGRILAQCGSSQSWAATLDENNKAIPYTFTTKPALFEYIKEFVQETEHETLKESIRQFKPE